MATSPREVRARVRAPRPKGCSRLGDTLWRRSVRPRRSSEISLVNLSSSQDPLRISVVMPTLNEMSNIVARAAEIQRQTGDWEWIVSDGGSRDGTVEAAERAGATVVRSPCGRGIQLDAGAAASSGEVLLFLHADTSLPVGAFDAIRATLRRPAVVGGNFIMRFDEDTVIARFLEVVYAGRQRFLRSYFGDSAIFARRSTYESIGGFGSMPIMEDYAFCMALQRRGATKRIPLSVATSSRRYNNRVMKTIWNWFAIMTLYRLGVTPEKLADRYRPNDAQEEPPLP